MILYSYILYGIFCSLLLGGAYTGWAEYLWLNDITYISFGIIGFTLLAYPLAFRYPDWAWMSQGLCMRFGLFGTIVGLIIMAMGLNSVDEFWTAVSSGLGTAFLTTGTGLVCSTFLMLHGWFLGMRD